MSFEKREESAYRETEIASRRSYEAQDRKEEIEPR